MEVHLHCSYLKDNETCAPPLLFAITYRYVLRLVLVFGLPLLLLIFVTVSLLIALWKRQRMHSSTHSSNASDNSITVTLITILVTFIVCQLPFAIVYTYTAVNPLYVCIPLYYFYSISRALEVVNSAANGVIYFFLNRKFRAALIADCRCNRNNTNTIEMANV